MYFVQRPHKLHAPHKFELFATTFFAQQAPYQQKLFSSQHLFLTVAFRSYKHNAVQQRFLISRLLNSIHCWLKKDTFLGPLSCEDIRNLTVVIQARTTLYTHRPKICRRHSHITVKHKYSISAHLLSHAVQK